MCKLQYLCIYLLLFSFFSSFFLISSNFLFSFSSNAIRFSALVKTFPDYFCGITGSLQKGNNFLSSKIFEKWMIFEELQIVKVVQEDDRQKDTFTFSAYSGRTTLKTSIKCWDKKWKIWKSVLWVIWVSSIWWVIWVLRKHMSGGIISNCAIVGAIGNSNQALINDSTTTIS